MNESDKPLIILFTSHYPFGHGEEFLENEVPILAKHFDITVVPYKIDGPLRDIPNNVSIDRELASLSSVSKIVKFTRGLKGSFRVFPDFFKEYMSIPNKKKFKVFRQMLSYLFALETFDVWYRSKTSVRQKLIERCKRENKIIFYSYWLTSLSFAINFIKRKYCNHVLTISRAHRYDLYEERIDNKYGYIPFRHKILKEIDKVFLISQDGFNYLNMKYPKYSEKYIISRLGVKRQPVLSQRSTDGVFRITSCSNLISVKRVHLIIQALAELSKEINDKIVWTHIGDGPLRKNLEHMASSLLGNSNISFRFLGRVPNNGVLSFYKENPVDLFISVSSSEGLPVSIMEALSFGIPIIATNVGGSSEIVNDEVGKLLPSNPSPKEIAKAIQAFILEDDNKKDFKRRKALEMWDKKVNADKNFSEFARMLLELSKVQHVK